MKKLLIIALLLLGATSASAQSITFVGSSPATLVGQVATTNSFDSSSCTPHCLAVLNVTYYDVSTDPAVAGGCGAGWTALTNLGSAGSGGQWQRWYYCLEATAAAGQQTSVTFLTSTFPIAGIMYFKSPAVFTYDAESAGGTTTGATTISSGSITPSASNDAVIVSGVIWSIASEAISVNGGFTEREEQQNDGATHVANSMAYLIQTTATAANPAWTWTTSGAGATRSAVFLSNNGGGGGATPCLRSLLGVGCEAKH